LFFCLSRASDFAQEGVQNNKLTQYSNPLLIFCPCKIKKLLFSKYDGVTAYRMNGIHTVCIAGRWAGDAGKNRKPKAIC
jgi:hypothetical protein